MNRYIKLDNEIKATNQLLKDYMMVGFIIGFTIGTVLISMFIALTGGTIIL